MLPVENLVKLMVLEPYRDEYGVHGTIDVLDVRFGSLWTNIPRSLFSELGVKYGDRLSITIENDKRTVYRNIIDQGSFARAYNISTGNSWHITITPFSGF